MKKIVVGMLIAITLVSCTNAGKGSDQTVDSIAEDVTTGEKPLDDTLTQQISTDTIQKTDSLHK